MAQLFNRRRVQASFIGSFLLHAVFFVGWSRQRQPSPAPGARPEIAVEVIDGPEQSPLRIAMAGERPSGRGHALAGSNPSRAGAPRHGVHARRPTGHATGSGASVAAPEQSTPPASTGAGEAVAEFAAPTGAPELIPLAPAATTDVPLAAEVTSPSKVPANVEADEAFDRLAREQLMRLARGHGGGLTGFGNGGAGIGIGLGTELSGRYVVESQVASAPVVVQTRPVECALLESLRLSATVHVLVTTAGQVAVPRLALSSGKSGFDACAVRYVLAMTFSPGLDAGGQPVPVWMDVRVRALAGGQIGAAP